MTRRAGLFEDVDRAGVRTFGVPITIQFAGIPEETGDGVYEAPGERVSLVDGFPVASTLPSVGIHLGDWTRAPRKGETILIGADTWEVDEVDPDGLGGASISLVRPRPA